jgi:hypothetical protein
MAERTQPVCGLALSLSVSHLCDVSAEIPRIPRQLGLASLRLAKRTLDLQVRHGLPHGALKDRECSAGVERPDLPPPPRPGVVVGVVKGEGNRDRRSGRLREGSPVERTGG